MLSNSRLVHYLIYSAFVVLVDMLAGTNIVIQVFVCVCPLDDICFSSYHFLVRSPTFAEFSVIIYVYGVY